MTGGIAKTDCCPCKNVHYFHIYWPSCNFTITHLSLFATYSLLNTAVCRRWVSYKNSVKWPDSPWVLKAQWIERQPSVWEVMGSNPIVTQIFSRSHASLKLCSHFIHRAAISPSLIHQCTYSWTPSSQTLQGKIKIVQDVTRFKITNGKWLKKYI